MSSLPERDVMWLAPMSKERAWATDLATSWLKGDSDFSTIRFKQNIVYADGQLSDF